MLVLGRLNFYGATTMAEDKHKSRDDDIAEIRALLRDSNRILKEHIAEAKKRSEDFDRQLAKDRAEAKKRSEEDKAEAKKRSEDFDRQLAKDRAEAKKRSEDFDRQLAKDRAEAKEFERRQEKRSQKVDSQLEELGKQIGGANNRWGKIVEELVAGDLSAIISKHLNGQAHILSTRVRPDDRSWEIDVLATNGDIAVPAEVKTTLSIDDIDRFVARILMRFTTLLPHHKHKRIYGVIAFVKIDGNESEVIDHALSQGLIVVKAMHGTNKVLNAKDFKPRDFCPRRK